MGLSPPKPTGRCDGLKAARGLPASSLNATTLRVVVGSLFLGVALVCSG